MDANLSTRSLKSGFSNAFKQGFHMASDWGGRAVKSLQVLSKRIENHTQTAIAVFVTANLLFFMMINWSADILDARVGIPAEKGFNRILINGLVAVSVLGYNLFLSKMTNYHLSKMILVAMSMAVVAGRIWILGLFQEEIEPSIIPIARQELDLDNHDNVEQADVKQVAKASKASAPNPVNSH